MNDHRPSQRQLAYLRHLAARAHDAGMPYLPLERLTRAGVQAWIAHLELVVRSHEEVRRVLAQVERDTRPYLVTPPREKLPPSYRPPWQDLPEALDHEHLVHTIRRADGVEESVCVLCGVSA